MLDQAKKAGKAKDDPIVKDYCKCDAKYEYDAPICKTECESTTTYHPVGDPTCACVFIPCKGNPCTQIKEYVSKIWDYYKKLKLYFIDYKIYMLKEPRSDIMKKLTYSRQTVNNCSVINNTHDLGTRLLSCTRVEDELISPVNTSKLTKNQLAILLHTTPAQINAGTVNGYCYGRDLGSLFGYPAKDKKKSLTDNWFCAQQYSKKPGSSGAGNGGGGGGGF
ncbi:MAG: hypothetical protein NT094_00135, partial [Candidatus Staskawiczbacteria bacterium]|nr:hypothetical protein [Candidatus Staskawiczbacteria bacterium]